MNENASPSNHRSESQALQPQPDQCPQVFRVILEGSVDQVLQVLQRISPRPVQPAWPEIKSRAYSSKFEQDMLADIAGLGKTLSESGIRSSDKNKS